MRWFFRFSRYLRMLRLCPLPVTAAHVLLLGRLSALRVPPAPWVEFLPGWLPWGCTSLGAHGPARRLAGGLTRRLARGLEGGGLFFIVTRLCSGPAAPPDDSLSGWHPPTEHAVPQR